MQGGVRMKAIVIWGWGTRRFENWDLISCKPCMALDQCKTTQTDKSIYKGFMQGGVRMKAILILGWGRFSNWDLISCKPCMAPDPCKTQTDKRGRVSCREG